MLLDLVLLAAGVVAAAIGGEFFVRGAVGLAAWAKVPAALIGATIAAFATSAPELSVGLQAASSDQPELALGDALGSNVANVAIVLGLVLVFGPLASTRRSLRRDLGVAAAAPVLTLFTLIDGRLVRSEALLLLAVFTGWLLAVGRHARRERSAAADLSDIRPGWPAIAGLVSGLVALVVAGRFIVLAAKGIGEAAGLDSFVVGATLVALGTSTPEIATAVISRRRGHADVGVGTVLGSNVFNNLWIVGVVASLRPIEVAASEVMVAIGACLLALALVVPNRLDVVPRWRGGALLTLAVLYTVVVVALGP